MATINHHSQVKEAEAEVAFKEEEVKEAEAEDFSKIPNLLLLQMKRKKNDS